MTHEEYVAQQRARAGLIAQRVVAGEMSVLEGSHQVARLDLELSDDDPDLEVIRAVESETDMLPIGESRAHWAEDALKSKEAELRKAETWARGAALDAFRHLAERFAAGLP